MCRVVITYVSTTKTPHHGVAGRLRASRWRTQVELATTPKPNSHTGEPEHGCCAGGRDSEKLTADLTARESICVKVHIDLASVKGVDLALR